MVVVPAVPTRSREWTPVLTGLRADLLDCVQVNLAALADRAYRPGAHLALGATLRFHTAEGPAGAPAVTASVDQRLAEAADLLGLRVTRRWDDVSGARLRELLAEHSPLYVVADTFTMSWLPYAGNQHMEHSFLLVDAGEHCVVADGYHNSTQWGDARPGVWRMSAADFDAAVPHATAMTIAAEGAPVLDRAAVLRDNAAALRAGADRIEGYLTAVRQRAGEPEAAAQLVLDVWLLGRSRALHAAWLAGEADAADAAREAADRADAWLALAGQSYVAMRRVRRGGVFPAPVLDQLTGLLRGEVALAGAGSEPPHGGPVADPDRIRAVLADEVRAVLGVGPEVPVDQRPLRTLPGFNSFRLVEVIERAEARLGVELEPDDLTGPALHDLDSLGAVFDRARPATQGVSGR
ncbi:phosphopantetheine-binding protein [Micromonospora peucetia]|uniref:Phosphopantetheine attachment site n=1 Tax=Micromonospora peucetia TaxID=47871 RepID=A0A1C6UKD4_9ACTN|nr:phosphopantetheine-binding protein [Micromonospora peucetia]WSA34233.1 phosphopantetheine-binding protein [Micromonospora peucetia]SCL54516.1 Phosphopantetheine attachment site [Micromonospora peucetia]